MELWSWITGEQIAADISPPSSLREPPEFLKIHKTKPPKSRLARKSLKQDLTPLELQLKDIILNVYSEKKRSYSEGSVAAAASEGEEEKQKKIRSFSESCEDSVNSTEQQQQQQQQLHLSYLENSCTTEEEQLLEFCAPGESKRNPPNTSFDSLHSYLNSQGISDDHNIITSTTPEDFVAGIDSLAAIQQKRELESRHKGESGTSPSGAKNPQNLGTSMSEDTQSVWSTDVTSLPAFSADDLNVNVDNSYSLLQSFGSLPYSNTATDRQNSSGATEYMQLPGIDPSGEVYSFTDSSTSKYVPSRKVEGRSGVMDSFGIDPQLLHSSAVNSRNQAESPKDVVGRVGDEADSTDKEVTAGISVIGKDDGTVDEDGGENNTSGVDGSTSGDNEAGGDSATGEDGTGGREDGTGDRVYAAASGGSVADKDSATGEDGTGGRVDAAASEVDGDSATGEDGTGGDSEAVGDSSTGDDSIGGRGYDGGGDVSETAGGSDGDISSMSDGHVARYSPSHSKSEDGKDKTPVPESIPLPSTSHPIISSCVRYPLETVGCSMELLMVDPHTESDEDPQPAEPYFPQMDSDVETASIVSIQQLTEDYLSLEPSGIDATTPLSEGHGMIPMALPIRKDNEPKHVEVHPVMKSPSMTTPRYNRSGPDKEVYSPGKHVSSPSRLPRHLSSSNHGARNVSHRDKPVSVEFVPLSVPTHSASSYLSSSNLVGSSENDDMKQLEGELLGAQKAQMYLKGQLETLQEEYDAAVEDRPYLLSRASQAEAKLAEATSALEREKTRKASVEEPVIKGSQPSTTHLETLSSLKEKLAQEKKATANLQGNLSKEKYRSDCLEKDLQDLKQKLDDKERTLADVQANADRKDDDSKENLCKLSSLQASYDALESSKQWLHDQLQEGLQGKLKLQEDFREAKASGIAQDIKCDQLQKENALLQQQVNRLRNGVLQDKEKLVSKLEEIEAGVLSREDHCSSLLAEKSQLEDMLQRKNDTIHQLNSELGKVKVQQEGTVDEMTQESIKLAQKVDTLERERQTLAKKLTDSETDLELKISDRKELEKVKNSLQDRLRQTDAEVVGKEKAVESITEARAILQQEVDMVNQIKDNIEKELEDTRHEVASVEADLKLAQDRDREREMLLKSTEESLRAMQASLAEKGEKLEEKEEMIEVLESQMKDVVKEFDGLQSSFQSIATDSGTASDSMAEKDRVIVHLSSLKERTEEELNLLKDENQDVKEQLTLLQHEKAHLQGQVEGAVQHDDYHRALQDKSGLQAELSQLKLVQQQEQIKYLAKTNRLERDLKEARKIVSNAQKDLQKMQERSGEDLSKLKAAKRQAEADLKAVDEHLQATVKEKEEIKAKLREKEKMEGALKASKSYDEQLETIRAQLTQEKLALTEQLQQELEQRQDVERASELVAAQLKQVAEEQRKELLRKNREVSLEVEKLRGKLVSMRTTQHTLRDHVAEVEVRLAKKESDIIKLSGTNQKLIEDETTQEGRAKVRIAALEAQIKAKQEEAMASQEKVQEEESKVEELERQVSKLEAERASLKDELTRNDCSGLNKRVSSLSSEKEALDFDLSYYKSQLLVAKTSADSAKRESASQITRVGVLESQLTLMKSRYQEAEDEVKQLKKHLESRDVSLHTPGVYMTQTKESSPVREPREQRREGVKLFSADLSGISGMDDVDHVTAVGSRQHSGSAGSDLRKGGTPGLQEAAKIHQRQEIGKWNQTDPKSRTLNTVQSYLESVRDDMKKLHLQVDQHSATFKKSRK